MTEASEAEPKLPKLSYVHSVKYNLGEPMNVYELPNRSGIPLTDEQRAARHEALTGVPTTTATLPPRGARKATLQAENSIIWWILILVHAGLIAGEIYLAHKAGLI